MKKPGPKLILILIFALFLAPVLVAVFLNSSWTDFRPALISSSGQLVEPAVGLTGRLENYRGVQLGPEVFNNRWWMISYAPYGCHLECLGRLTELRQIHRSLGKDQPAVGVALISGVSLEVNQVEKVHAVFEDIIQLYDFGGQYQRQINELTAKLSGSSPYTFIVDPMANLILLYQADADPAGIRQDLARLLRLSQRDPS